MAICRVIDRSERTSTIDNILASCSARTRQLLCTDIVLGRKIIPNIFARFKLFLDRRTQLKGVGKSLSGELRSFYEKIVQAEGSSMLKAEDAINEQTKVEEKARVLRKQLAPHSLHRLTVANIPTYNNQREFMQRFMKTQVSCFAHCFIRCLCNQFCSYSRITFMKIKLMVSKTKRHRNLCGIRYSNCP